MGTYQRPLRLIAVLILLSAVFAVVASSVTRSIQIKVIRVDVHSLTSQTPVPKDCDLQNFSAYCNNSTNATEQVVMLVLEDDGKYYRRSCFKDSRFSNCSPLSEGETFEARVEKNGLTVIFRNSKGKQRKQLYQVVGPVPPPQTDTSVDVQPPPTVPRRNAPAPAAAPAPAVSVVKEGLPDKVRCNFNSIPAASPSLVVPTGEAFAVQLSRKVSFSASCRGRAPVVKSGLSASTAGRVPRAVSFRRTKEAVVRRDFHGG
jgi:hypothetical protein